MRDWKMTTALAAWFLPRIARAQQGGFDLGSAKAVGLPGGLVELLGGIIRTGLTLVAVLALAFLVYGGFLYVTSGGDENQIGRAKHTIMYAILGMLFIGIAWAVVTFIIRMFSGGGGGPQTVGGVG